MPAFLAAAVAAAIPATTAIAFAGLTWATVIANGALLIGGIVLSNSQRKRAKEQARAAENASQVDRMAMVVSSVMKRELVLGRVRKGGSVFFRGSTGQYKSTFLLGQALAGHEIDGIEAVYLADQAVTLDANGWVLDAPYNQENKVSASAQVAGLQTVVNLERTPIAGSVSVVIPAAYDSGSGDTPLPFSVSGNVVTLTGDPNTWISGAVVRYQYAETNSCVRVWWELGSADAQADARARELFPAQWTADHRGRGVAKLWSEWRYNETAFPNGLPAITVRLRGARVYDPRTGMTAFSENPALHIRHVYQHPSFGKSAVTATEDARIIAAANACDTNNNYVVAGVTTTRALYKAALVATYGTAARDLMDDLAQAMGGMWAYAGGELYARAGVYTAPVRSFTGSDLAVISRSGESEQQNPISITPHRERARKINTVDLRIWDAAQDYKMAPITSVSAPSLIARDGGKALSDGEVVMPAVTFAPQAQHIAGILLRDGRDPLTVRLPFKLRAYAIEVFDTISISRPRNGWNLKQFIVIAREWDAANGVVWLTLKETAAAIFQPDASFPAQGYAQNSALPRPWDISPPLLIDSRVYSGTSELVRLPGGGWMTVTRVTWDAVQDQSIARGGFIDVEWTRADRDQWVRLTVDGAATEARLVGTEDGAVILIRARSRNGVAASAWSVQVAHKVLGKTEPPAPALSISLTQELVFINGTLDKDSAGWGIRSLPGRVTDPVYSRGTDLLSGYAQTSPARIERRLFGVNTIVVVQVDDSGNQSEVRSAVLDFGQPDLTNIAQARNFKAEGYPGVLTACSVSGGNLVADADPSSDIDVLPDLDSQPDIDATLYRAMTWQVETFIPMYGGGIITVDHPTTGGQEVLEYRVDGDTILDLDAVADLDAMDDVDGGYSAWQPWPGALGPWPRHVGIQLRGSIDGGSEQGSYTSFTVSLVAQLASQLFTNVVISASGTRLAPSTGSPPLTWIAIKGLSYFPVSDGSGAQGGRVNNDFSPALGPLVELLNNAGVPVDGRCNIEVKGLIDA